MKGPCYKVVWICVLLIANMGIGHKRSIVQIQYINLSTIKGAVTL